MKCETQVKKRFLFAEQPFSKIFSVVPKLLELLACSCKKCNEQCSCYINGLTCTDACKCGDCSSIDYDGNDDIDNICDYTDDDEYSDDDEVEDDDVDENNDDQ